MEEVLGMGQWKKHGGGWVVMVCSGGSGGGYGSYGDLQSHGDRKPVAAVKQVAAVAMALVARWLLKMAIGQKKL